MKTGDQAPNISFLYPDGRAGTLADFAGRKLLLIFLRHLG
jgi:hypothetical protein